VVTRKERDLLRRIADGDRRAAATVLERVRSVDGAARALWLDPLAVLAGSNSEALVVLLTAIDDCGLADPAIRALIVDPGEVEEVRQDVLIRVTRSIRSFRGDARFESWLSAVARHATIDTIRRKRHTVALDDDAEVSDQQRLSSMIATRESVRAMLDDLDELYRLPLVLREIDGRSYDEISETLGLPLNTVKSRIFRGRALLTGMVDTTDG
jgi:RNA polymerase sigma-70 factor, ECF subfamily